MHIEQGFQLLRHNEPNAYTSDLVLPSLLKRTIPETAFSTIDHDLKRLGEDITNVIRPLGAGNRAGPPQFTQYDHWGKRVDILQTSEGWRDLKAVVQREGLPAIFYEREFGEYSRLYGFAKMMLIVGDGHEIFCPMSMTDGAARVIELMGTPELKKQIFSRLISRDPSRAFTSGQWMTERPGGSDVSQTETVARSGDKDHAFGPVYTLNGFKWFSSATDSDISLALARTGSVQDGSRGLSLFLIPLRHPLLRNAGDSVPSPISNNIFIHRMKNKIGTHALPTAELSLEGAEAFLIGAFNQGVKNISPVLNITRVWSAIGSVGALRKCLAISTAYANVRAIQGGKRLLRDAPLHVAQLASINIVYRALTHLTFGVVALLGKSECETATADEKCRLRLMTPLVKAFAAEKACTAMEEAMTALGGQGYMEENDIGRLIRDGLVEKIWEGTTTVMALDVVRAVKDRDVLLAFFSWTKNVMSASPKALQNELQPALSLVASGIRDLSTAYDQPMPALLPRPALMLLGHIASSIFLLEHATWAYNAKEPTAATDVEAFMRWVEEGGLIAAIADVKRTKDHSTTDIRVLADSALVFGTDMAAKL